MPDLRVQQKNQRDARPKAATIACLLRTVFMSGMYRLM